MLCKVILRNTVLRNIVDYFQGTQNQRVEPDSILEMENRFRSDWIGASETDNTHLYPNRWDFSIKNEDSGHW